MDKIELEVIRRYLGEEGKRSPGDVIVVSAARANHLIKKKVARIKSASAITTEKGQSAKKSSGAPMVGPSTRSASSSAPGVVQRLSVSPVGPASRVISVISSIFKKAKGSVGLSQ